MTMTSPQAASNEAKRAALAAGAQAGTAGEQAYWNAQQANSQALAAHTKSFGEFALARGAPQAAIDSVQQQIAVPTNQYNAAIQNSLASFKAINAASNASAGTYFDQVNAAAPLALARADQELRMKNESEKGGSLSDSELKTRIEGAATAQSLADQDAYDAAQAEVLNAGVPRSQRIAQNKGQRVKEQDAKIARLKKRHERVLKRAGRANDNGNEDKVARLIQRSDQVMGRIREVRGNQGRNAQARDEASANLERNAPLVSALEAAAQATQISDLQRQRTVGLESGVAPELVYGLFGNPTPQEQASGLNAQRTIDNAQSGLTAMKDQSAAQTATAQARLLAGDSAPDAAKAAQVSLPTYDRLTVGKNGKGNKAFTNSMTVIEQSLADPAVASTLTWRDLERTLRQGGTPLSKNFAKLSANDQVAMIRILRAHYPRIPNSMSASSKDDEQWAAGQPPA